MDLPIKNLGHITIQMRNNDAMLAFYKDVLGLKRVFSLSMADMLESRIEFLEKHPEILETMSNDEATGEEQLAGMKETCRQSFMKEPFLVYLKISDRQFLELLYERKQDLQVIDDISKYSGFQNICFEVTDIHKTWDIITGKGIESYTGLNFGADGAWQFWVKDPDGNQVEFMEYTDEALQLK